MFCFCYMGLGIALTLLGGPTALPSFIRSPMRNCPFGIRITLTLALSHRETFA